MVNELLYNAKKRMFRGVGNMSQSLLAPLLDQYDAHSGTKRREVGNWESLSITSITWDVGLGGAIEDLEPFVIVPTSCMVEVEVAAKFNRMYISVSYNSREIQNFTIVRRRLLVRRLAAE